MTPKAGVKAICVACLGLERFNTEAIRGCQGDRAFDGPCPFFPYRMGKRISVKVFRAFCRQCMGGVVALVGDCSTTACPAHPYRFGKNPAMGGRGASPEAMERVRGSRKIFQESLFSDQGMVCAGIGSAAECRGKTSLPAPPHNKSKGTKTGREKWDGATNSN